MPTPLDFGAILSPAQLECLRARKPRIVLPEGAVDARVMIAAAKAAAAGFLQPILLGRRDDLETAASVLEVSLKGCEPVYLSDSPVLEKIVQYYQTQRAKEGLRPDQARAALLGQPVLAAAAMVGAGIADGMVAGAVTPTPEVIRAAVRLVGTAESAAKVTSLMALHFPEGHAALPGGLLIYCDPAVVPNPTAEDLAHAAAEVSRAVARIFPDLPQRIAFLSYSTRGSASHPTIDLVRAAAASARALLPGIPIEGEMQADAALIPSVAGRKAPGTQVPGNATVLVFPDLDAANIGYKLTRHLAGARAYGPLLCGLRRPVSDLSRSATAEEIFATLLLTAAACFP